MVGPVIGKAKASFSHENNPSAVGKNMRWDAMLLQWRSARVPYQGGTSFIIMFTVSPFSCECHIHAHTAICDPGWSNA
jgi:hypothetical protein